MDNIDSWIKENYKKFTKSKICEILNINIRDLRRKAKELGVINIEKSNNMVNRNKKNGRDLSYEVLRDIAIKYKTRGNFQMMDGSAYTTARVKGYLDDICSHMIHGSYSIPQIILSHYLKKLIGDDYLYNTRKIIPPYEIDIYFTKYKLGFEYNGKGWHTNENKRDIIKSNLCNESNITIINIDENNRKYEKDIKSQLIEKLELINYITKLNIQEIDILSLSFDYNMLNDMIIDKESVINVISEYKTLKDFRMSEDKLYKFLIRKKLTNLLSNLDRCGKIWDDDSILSEISKYEYIGDFYKYSSDCYNHIRRNKKDHLISHLKHKKTKRTIESDIQELKSIIPIPHTKYKLQKVNNKLFLSLYRKLGKDELGKILIELSS